MLNWYSDWHVSANYDYQNYIIEGEVLSASSLETTPDYIEFKLSAHSIGKDSFRIFKPKLLLRWYQPDFTPKQGNKIRVFGMIKPLSTYANPEQRFNVQKFLTAQGVHRIVVLKNSPSNDIRDTSTSVRQKIIERIGNYPIQYAPWLLALGVGHRDELQNEDWDLLQTTSTAHLFSISGMHLALVAGYLMIVSRVLIPVIAGFVTSHRMLMKTKDFLVLMGCYGYVVLAGEQLPVIRAFTAIVIVVLYAHAETPLTSAQLFIRVLFVVTLLFPLSLLSTSYWLSFGAVLILLSVIAINKMPIQNSITSKLFVAFRIQWVFFLVSLPLTLALWEQTVFVSIFANIVLIPLISLILLPSLLLVIILNLVGIGSTWLIICCDFLMHVCIEWLTKLTSINQQIEGANTGYLGVFFCVLTAVFLWQKLRLVSVSLLCLGCLWASMLSPRQTEELVFFDVGHGNSAILNHPDATIIIDFAKGNDLYSILSREIHPYITAQNINQIDLGIVSHFDADHAGGLGFLLEQDSINTLWSPRAHCRLGSRFKRDNLSMVALWPPVTSSGSENNDSCVILLTVNGTRILFTGDITAEEELALVRRWPSLTVDVLLAPHHGSRTSSSDVFVNSLMPEIVVFSTPYPSHWGHPHNDVVQRYENIGARIVHLGKSGALKVTWRGDEIKLSTMREDLYNRWYYKK